jgi:starch-binding outer membrane protein, SusD/RagB family
MKNIKIYLAILSVLLIFSRCSEDVLNIEPKDKMTFKLVISDLTGLESSILGVYDRGRFPYTSDDLSMYKNCYTDDLTPGSNLSDQGNFNKYARLTSFDSKNQDIKDLWDAYYFGLSRANIIIFNIDNVKINASNPSEVARKNRVLGEALYFRAYFHASLVQYWDNILLADHIFDDPYEKVSLAKREDVYKLIEKDLLKAIDLLPSASDIETDGIPNRGRATKGVARHLLSLAYMDMASYIDNSYYAKAAEMAKAVVDDPAYVLLPTTNITDIFSVAHQDNKEIIFAWQCAKSEGSSPQRCSVQLIPLYDRVSGVIQSFEQGGRCWSRLLPTKYYFSLFEPTDARLDAWHIRYWVFDTNTSNEPLPTGVNIGDTLTKDNIGAAGGYASILIEGEPSVIVPTTRKYFEDATFGRVITQAEGYRNIILYRKSQAYLIAAEAYMRSGQTAVGQPYLDAIRARAGVASIPLNEQNILDEQLRELGQEGHRFPMLKRLGILISQCQKYSSEVGDNMTENNVRWPLPKTFVDLTKVPQNPGFE